MQLMVKLGACDITQEPGDAVAGMPLICTIGRSGSKLNRRMDRYALLDFAFWQAFVSNAAATLVGVVLGIPIALWISRHQAKTEEKERKKKILTLLYDELLADRDVLFGWHDSQDQKSEARILSAILRYESWKAFSDGGELGWIRDPGLLNTISEAYFMIRSVSQLSDRYFGMLMVDWEQVSSLAMRNVYDNFRMSCSRAIESTDKALKEIGALVTNK